MNTSRTFSDQKPKVVKILLEVERRKSGTLGTIKATTHRIELEPGSNPVHQQGYCTGQTQQEHERTEIETNHAESPSHGAHKNRMGIVDRVRPKNDGQLRFRIDYSRLNALTVRDSYPISRMDECIELLEEAKVFLSFE